MTDKEALEIIIRVYGVYRVKVGACSEVDKAIAHIAFRLGVLSTYKNKED